MSLQDALDNLANAIEEMVEEKVKELQEDIEVDANNVDGLERKIEDEVEKQISDNGVDANDVKGLEDYIQDTVNQMTQLEIESGNVNGLEDFIKDEVDKYTLTLKIEDIPEFDKAVRDVLKNGLNVEQMLGLDELVVDCLSRPAVKSALDQAVKESLARVFNGLLLPPIIRT